MIHFDTIIIGSGPSGISAASKLAVLGHNVALIADAERKPSHQLETVASLGVLDHAFPDILHKSNAITERQCRGISWWSGTEMRTEAVAVIDRSRLHDGLLVFSRTAGISMHSARPSDICVRFDSRWLVSFGETHLDSQFLIDACGRYSFLRKRTPLVQWKQVAVIGLISAHKARPTLWTESLQDGWLWAIRYHDNHWVVSAFVDPASLRHGVEQAFDCLLKQSRFAEGTNLQPTLLRTMEVTPSATVQAFNGNLIHIGDAALARDPLSSQGLSAAVSDGQCAAIAIHTLLCDASMRDVVAEFVTNRYRRAIRVHLKFLEKSYASSPFETQFWLARKCRTEKPTPAMQSSVAMDRPLTIASTWNMREEPVIEGDAIRMALCLTSDDDSLRWLAGRAIQDLLPRPSQAETGAELIRRWHERHQFSELTALRALHWLTAQHVLEPMAQT